MRICVIIIHFHFTSYYIVIKIDFLLIFLNTETGYFLLHLLYVSYW